MIADEQSRMGSRKAKTQRGSEMPKPGSLLIRWWGGEEGMTAGRGQMRKGATRARQSGVGKQMKAKHLCVQGRTGSLCDGGGGGLR